MSKNSELREVDSIRFSIGAKLITIITILVVISLGSITILVSLMFHADLRMTAEDNNYEVNRRSSMEAETYLKGIRSDSRVFIQTVAALGSQTSAIKESEEFFFAENPLVAAVFFIVPGKPEQIFTSKSFFSYRHISEDLALPFIDSQRTVMGRAVRGETVLINAAPHFSRSILAMFFPWQNGGAGAVLFSSENLNNNFGFGVNQSYMINADGDLLSHADFTIIKNGTNIADLDFIKTIFDSEDRSKQELLESDFGVMEVMPRAIEKDVILFLQEKLNMLIIKTRELLARYNLIDIHSHEKKLRQYIAFTKLNIAGTIVITSIEYDRIFEGINATTRRNIYLTIAVLSLSIIFIWFFSKSISVPLKALSGVARRIEGGDFNMDMQPKSNDEVGVLTSSFSKMCSALNIFGRFTNREIAVKAMRGEIKPGGLPKHGTVFFSDIREFTAKSENFTKFFGAEASDKIVHWLNHYFTHMIECVEKTNGVVDKFIGDAVMAHWGTAYTAGTPRKDAFNCIKAALMMRKALYFMNKERKAGDPANPNIRIGCGINSGMITAGQLGSDMRMEYTVIGDPVNLASRIEALTKPLAADILISEDTWRLIGDLFVTEEMPAVTVKGKEKPVRIFAIINFTGEMKGPQNLDEVRSLLGIDIPDLEEIDVNADEKKYKIGE